MFGGYQLLQTLSMDEVDSRLGQQAALWQEMKKGGLDHRIHVEFADFQKMEFFKLFEKHVVRHSNSLGMNEQEMMMLLDYWNGKADLQVRDSKPSFQDILSQIDEFFKKQKERGYDINRIHLHPYGSFFMCYDKSKWNSAKDALLKSALVVPKYCKSGPFRDSQHVSEEELLNFETGDMPEYFINPSKPHEKIHVSRDKLDYSFDLSDDIHCDLQFFVKCKKVFKTAGMGDTISGTGFIYHTPK